MPELMCEALRVAAQAVSRRRQLLNDVLRALDEQGIAWCLPQGGITDAECPLDVDLTLQRTCTPRKLASLLHARRHTLGARIVNWLDDGVQWMVLATEDLPITFLQLHVSYDYELDSRIFYHGEEILDSRIHQPGRSSPPCVTPAASIQFGCILVNRISKARLDPQRQAQLTTLFAQDPSGCSVQIERFFSASWVRVLSMSARTGDWEEIVERIEECRSDLFRQRRPAGRLARWHRRLKRWIFPQCGFHTVFLGPDGVGKSTVIEGVQALLSPAFLRTNYFTFAPTLIPQRLQQEKAAPHALPPRSRIASLVKAAWWLACYAIGYRLLLRADRARATLVLNHRYLLDAIVDPRRYRYSGPIGLLRFIWLFACKPDLVISLDADPMLIHGRKQDLPLDEISRQRQAYRALVKSLDNGQVIDAAQFPDEVITQVSQLILDRMAAGMARRIDAREAS